uniref:Integrase zinc-binding domain-containing protein n=1 Tax=Panagrolaimus sp. ES5 TaxID=591445 RepID=A0AC34GT32_9BILA
MSERFQINLQRTIKEVLKIRDEYNDLLANNPPPWPMLTKIKMKAKIQRIKQNHTFILQSLDKWEESAKKIKNVNDKKLEYEKFDEWRNNDENSNLLSELTEIIIIGNEYLQLEDDDNCSVYSNSTQNLSTTNVNSSIKIPPLNIQKFHGNYLDYNSFWQRFKYLVHENPYPKVEKLIALYGLLGGKALEAVEGFQMAEENYDTVVQILSDRFGNQNMILQELHSKLRSIPRAKSTSESLRITVDSINKICRELKNFGVDINSDSTRLDIIDKMPPHEKDKLTLLNVSNPRPSTDIILEKMNNMVFKAEIADKNRSLEISHPFLPYSKYSSDNQRRYDNSSSNAAPFSKPIQNKQLKNSETFSSKKYACSLCEENHPPSNCPNFPSVDDKIKQLKLKNYCTRCAWRNHNTQQCRTNTKCNNCSGKHYSFLCLSKQQQKNGAPSNAFVAVEKQQGCLLTKEVLVMNPDTNESSTAVIFFDSGSQRSFVSDKLIGQLKLPREGKESLNLQGIGAKAINYMSSLVKIRIKTVQNYQDIYANSIKRIANTVPVITVKNRVEDFSSNCIDMVNKNPDILIGMDYFFEFITSFDNRDDIFIVESKVGKMLSKKIKLPSTSTISALAIEPTFFQNDENSIQNFWKLEAMGINDNSTNENEAMILEKFKKSINFKDKRFYVSWPEKTNHDRLPSNYGLSLGRLNSNLKKLQENPKLMKEYQNIFDTQYDAGKIEVAPEKPQGRLIHYLPHHAVVNESKTTTKVRMVFDASAKISKNTPSLNECFIRGPLEMPDICGILFRIRTSKILLTGDIEKAFHQVFLNECDRDAVRFLWVKDPTKPATGKNLIVLRFVAVPFGIISSPFILWIIIIILIQRLKNDKLRQMIKDNTYVDNIYLLCDDEDDAIQLFEQTRKHFLTASMNIREWLSNNSKVNDTFPSEIKQKSRVAKILGIQWDSQEDTLMFELKNEVQDEKWTKRKVLKFIASTYDPLGMLSPVSIKGKIFMQSLFQQNLFWDTPLSAELQKEWQTIVQKWKGTVTIPRKLVHGTMPGSDSIEIHAFADASKTAYCACVYLRIKTSMGHESHLVFAKTRLHPLSKNLTIPKMEIMGIWLASKIASFVKKEFKLETSRKFIWTDSQISFFWFQKLPKDVFVSNRLKDVLASNVELLFIPGTLNPADLGTRGISFEELKAAKHWWHGPQFLKQPKETWPQTKDLTQTITALVSLATNEQTAFVVQNVEINREYEIESHSSWTNFKNKIAMKLKNFQSEKDLNATDLMEAETILLKQEQQIFFTPKIEKELKLAKDEIGIYRIHTRFDHAEMINPTPIFLPINSPITKMIVMDIHEKLHHSGVPHTLSKVREKFWLTSGRATVKKILQKCKICKIWKGKPFAMPNMPSLPSSRVIK